MLTVSARKVTLWQAAVLAGLPRAPSRFNPRVNPDAAIARAKEVLGTMVASEVITAEQANSAAGQIVFPPNPVAPGWFADWIADQSQSLLAPDTDAVLRTTLDSRWQTVVARDLAAVLDGPGTAAMVTSAAAWMCETIISWKFIWYNWSPERINTYSTSGCST